MSASKPNKSDQRDDEVTLASSPAGGAKPVITDDETTGHDDTTTHERRRHLVKPIIVGIPNENPQGTADRARVRTLRSIGAPRKRSRWFWPAVIACLGGGGLIAWRTLQSRKPAPPQTAAPSVTQTVTASASAEAPPLLQLSLDVHVETAGARVQIDGKPLDKTEGVEIELPCPRGFHELRVEAPDRRPVVKRIPCEGRVVMDLSLDER